jgi:hypothetical protein
MRLYEQGKHTPSSCGTQRDGDFSTSQSPSGPAPAYNQQRERRQRSSRNLGSLTDGNTKQPSSLLSDAFIVIEHGPDGKIAIDEDDAKPGHDTNDGPSWNLDAAEAVRDEFDVEDDVAINVDINIEDAANTRSSNAVVVGLGAAKQRLPRKRFNPRQRRETAETRKQKACVRCQIQKCRVGSPAALASLHIHLRVVPVRTRRR